MYVNFIDGIKTSGNRAGKQQLSCHKLEIQKKSELEKNKLIINHHSSKYSLCSMLFSSFFLEINCCYWKIAWIKFPVDRLRINVIINRVADNVKNFKATSDVWIAIDNNIKFYKQKLAWVEIVRVKLTLTTSWLSAFVLMYCLYFFSFLMVGSHATWTHFLKQILFLIYSISKTFSWNRLSNMQYAYAMHACIKFYMFHLGPVKCMEMWMFLYIAI